MSNTTQSAHPVSPEFFTEPQFKAIFEYSGMGIALADLNGTILLSNPALQRKLGYTAEELRGIHFSEVTLQKDLARENELYDEMLRGERLFYKYDKQYSRKDGTNFWGRVTVTLIEPERQYVITIVEDIHLQRELMETLHDNEERFRLMVEGSTEVFFFQHDTEFRFTYVSPSIKSVLGYEPTEVIGKSTLDFVANKESAMLVQNNLKHVSGPEIRREPYVIEGRHKNGSSVPVEVLESYSVDRSGVIDVRGFARDITARKAAARQLELSDQILRSINAIVVVANGEGQLIYISPSATRLLGYSASELLGYGWWLREGESNELRREACELVAASARGERPVRRDIWEEVKYDKAGTPHWLLWQDTKGPGDLLIGIAQDITERKKIDEELTRRSLQLRAIFDSTTDGMFIVDDDLRYVDANPAACRILERKREEIIGRAVGEFSEPGTLPVSFFERLRKEGSFVGDHQIIQLDGTRVDVEVLVKANILPGLHLSILRDVTERKHLEQQLLQSQKMEALGRLAGGVAHDVNNMLMAIRGYGELLQHKCKNDARSVRYIDNILHAVDRAALTTKQLLAFSRQQVVQPQELNLNSVVVEMGKLLQRTIGEDIQLQLSLATDLGVIKADPGEIGQVLLNLAINAKDAMPNGGSLFIATSNVTLDANYLRTHLHAVAGEYILLNVTDTGCGMDATTVSRIFEPFFTTKAPGKGTGLGLPMIYGIVKQAGGAIYVYSEPGEGTSFKVYFPRMDATAATVAKEDRKPHHGRTILVLDDDAGTNEVLSEHLRGQGFTVLQAKSGKDALHLCQNHENLIDVIVSDVTMPGTNGQDIQGLLAIRHPGAKVIYISGFSRESLHQRGILPADSVFLQKPFRFEELCSKLEQAFACEHSDISEIGEF